MPLLTISVPTYRRVDLLERCLTSITSAKEATTADVELVISDNSPDAAVEQLVGRFSASWPGALRYYRNPPGTGAVRNFNHCIERANGQYNLMLHDDDYLLAGAVDNIVRILHAADATRDKVLLFGVHDVDLVGRVIRRRQFRRDQFLAPPAALRHLLGNSSFVRVPGLVVQNASYEAVGGFDTSAYTTCDFDMSVRLFSRFGVRCVPLAAAAYTVHPGGITSTVFTRRTIMLDLRSFEVARRSGVLTPTTVERLQRRFFHQFILAGTWRALKRRDRERARQVYALFELPEIRAQGPSPRWLPVRAAFAVLSGALWRRTQSIREDTPSTPLNAGTSEGPTPPGVGSSGGEGSAADTIREW